MKKCIRYFDQNKFAQAFLKNSFVKLLLTCSDIKNMLNKYGLFIYKIIFLILPLVLTGCLPHISVSGRSDAEGGSSTPIKLNSLSNNGHVNISNQGSFALSGTCSGDGVGNIVIEDASNTVLAMASCTNGAWNAVLDFSSGFPDGTINLEIILTDAKGVAHSLERSLVKLTVTPTIAITSPAINAYINNGNRSAFLVSGSCDVVGGTISVTGGLSTVNTTCNGSIWSANLSFPGNTNGAPNVTATIRDAANNQASASRSFILDTVNPTIAISSPAAGAYINIANEAAFAITGTCSENGLGNVRIEDAANNLMATIDCVSGSWSTSLDFSGAYADGPQTLEISQTDLAGNNSSAVRTFNIDKTAPNLTWSRVVDGICVGTANISSFAVQGSCTNGDSIITISSPQLTTSQTASCSGGSYSTTLSFSASGLNLHDSFNVQVVQTDSAGNSTSVTHSLKYIASTTPAISFAGWDDVYSVGKKTYRDGNPSEPGEVSIKWKEWASPANTCQPEGVKVYRSDSMGATTLVSENLGVPPTTRRFADNLSESDFGKAWYYSLQLKIAGLEYDITTPAEISEIRVIAPPNNMALVHRWITNQEVCGLMGLATDPTNHFRCAYMGQGHVGGYHDMQHDLLVDRFELGCKVSATCGAGGNQECLPQNFSNLPDPSSGSGVPGAIGSVYYNNTSVTDSGMCFVKSGPAATNWMKLSFATDPEVVASVTNEAHAAPLGHMSRQSFHDACVGQSITICQLEEYPDNSANSISISKRLLRLKELRAAAAWSRESVPSPYSSADEWIDNVEKSSFVIGDPYGRIGKCNTNNFKSSLTAANREFLSSFSIHRGAFETGSKIATIDCQSRYGIQDLVGNLQEVVSDEINCPDGLSCYGQSSTIDPDNTDMNGFAFNGVQGPGGSASVGSWGFHFAPHGSNYFNSVLGIPLRTNESGAVHTNTMGYNFFHGDFIYLDTDNVNTEGNPIGNLRYLFTGGFWSFGESGQSGRWTSVFNLDSNSWGGHMGARCMAPVK